MRITSIINELPEDQQQDLFLLLNSPSIRNVFVTCINRIQHEQLRLNAPEIMSHERLASFAKDYTALQQQALLIREFLEIEKSLARKFYGEIESPTETED